MMVEPKREILLLPLLRVGLLRAWAARDDFLRLAIVPVIVLLVIAAPMRDALLGLRAGLDAEAAKGAPPQADLGALLRGLLLVLLQGAAAAVFAVNWVRQLTLGKGAAPGLGLAISTRHVRFLLLMVVLTIAVALPGLILAAVTMVVLQDFAAGILATIVLGMLLWTALIARLSPSWIGIAIDARMPLAIAWARTAGQGFKLVLAVLAVEVTTMILQELITEILVLVGFVSMAPYSFMLLTLAVGLAGLAAQISILVSAFPHFLRETV